MKVKWRLTMMPGKYTARTIALMLSVAVVGVCAEQRYVQMTFSGTGGASAIDLKQPGTRTGEENVEGNGTLGPFSFRNVNASSLSPQPSSTCSNVFFPRVAGGGLLRFHDGSLLSVNLVQGGDCIDFVHLTAHCTLTFQITGGTGRFKNASGMLTYSETPVPLLFDPSNTPVFFAETGEFTGTIYGLAAEEEGPDKH